MDVASLTSGSNLKLKLSPGSSLSLNRRRFIVCWLLWLVVILLHNGMGGCCSILEIYLEWRLCFVQRPTTILISLLLHNSKYVDCMRHYSDNSINARLQSSIFGKFGAIELKGIKILHWLQWIYSALPNLHFPQHWKMTTQRIWLLA